MVVDGVMVVAPNLCVRRHWVIWAFVIILLSVSAVAQTGTTLAPLCTSGGAPTRAPSAAALARQNALDVALESVGERLARTSPPIRCLFVVLSG